MKITYATILCVAASQTTMADFSDMDNAAAGGASTMQQSRQLDAAGSGYGSSAGDVSAASRQNGNADGEVEFQISFKGKGRSKADNAMYQSRAFNGSLYQERGVNMYGQGNTYTQGYWYQGYPYPYAYAYTPYFIPYWMPVAAQQ